MIFHLVQGELKSHEPKDVAKSIFDYFVWQHRAAIQHEIETRSRYNSAVAANHAAQTEYDKEDMGGVGGFEAHLPYSDQELKKMQRDSEISKKDLDDARALLNFIRDRFVEKFVS